MIKLYTFYCKACDTTFDEYIEMNEVRKTKEFIKNGKITTKCKCSKKAEMKIANPLHHNHHSLSQWRAEHND